MINFKNISDISLEQNEYCVLRGVQKYNNSYFKVHIPKLMISTTSPMNDSFNRNILVNAKDCKPSISTSLYVKDSINIKKSPQCTLSHKVINDFGDLPDNLGVICLCINGNYRNMTITDSI